MASVPRILKDAGYATLFLHGAYRGSMWFDQFAARSGFDTYIAKEDFPDPARQSDSTWGIFDHYALERLHAELEAARKPVFAFFFSLSSHTPYELPDPKFRKFPPGTPHRDQLDSFAYTDWALGRFFELARASSYWRDTVFVVTADHNVGGAGLNRRQAMHIPLLILVPGDPAFPRGAVRDTLGGQVDLAPTVLQLLGISAAQDFAGNSLLAPARRRFVMFGLGGQAAWLDEDTLLLHDLTRAVAAFRYRADPGLTRNVLPELSRAGTPDTVRDFESYLQATNNLLVRNRVFPPHPPRP
jgi:phosphoglycerol transferase MdoB-like AlkP superfamily enzyme